MAAYQPGECNIGPRERRKRRLLGLASLFSGAAYAVAVVAVEWPPVALLVTFPFVVGAVLNLLQSREGFCAGLAVMERYDFSDDGGDADRVHNAAAVRTDRLRAGRLVAKSILLALLVTGVLYVAGVVILGSVSDLPGMSLLRDLSL